MITAAENQAIIIDQTVHGYSEGHRLLESSNKFAPDTERTLLVLSDMSGPSMLRGFEEYLSGYSLPLDNGYAFAKTWYAPEMERAGCVWTHTLIIRSTDISRVKDFHLLLSLFARPSKNRLLEHYRKPILLDAHSRTRANDSFSADDVYPELVSHLLASLYQKDNQTVFVPADSSKQYEDLVVRVWTQQWPELRSSFQFCTGALSTRKAKGELFDLQVVPRGSLTRLLRDVPTAYVIDSTFIYSGKPGSWTDEAETDLFGISDGQFRKFLWRYGADSGQGRAGFSSLARVFNLIKLEKGTSLNKLIGLVAHCFPHQKQAAKLKREIFGPVSSTISRLPAEISESKVLNELAQTRHYNAFDSKALSIENRAQALLRNRAADAKRLSRKIFSAPLSPIGMDFLVGIAGAISAQQAVDFAEDQPGLLEFFLKHNPPLALYPTLWSLDASSQRVLFDTVITELDPSPASLSGIVSAMLDAGSDVLVEEIIAKTNGDALAAVLQWYDETDSAEVAKRWRSALQLHPRVMVEWLSSPGIKEKTISLILSLLDPHSTALGEYGPKPWLRLARDAPSLVRGQALNETMAFVLALGFHNWWPESSELVAHSFQQVHDAAEDNRLHERNWKYLSNQAPSLGWFSSWDKCKRLRIALIDNFISHKWSVDHFSLSIKRVSTWHQMVNDCSFDSRRKRFLYDIATRVDNPILPTIESPEILAFSSQADSFSSRAELARVYLAQNKFSDAEQLLLDLIKQRPRQLGLRLELAKVYQGQKKYEEAERVLRDLIESHPSKLEARTELAGVFQSQGKYEEAEGLLRAALTVDPDNMTSRSDLAQIYQRQKRWDDAERILIESVQIEPDQLKPRLDLARIYQKQKRWQEAERILIESLKIGADKLHPRLELSRIYQRQKRWLEAEQILVESLKTDPNPHETRLELSRIYQKQKRWLEAERLLVEALERDFDQLHPRLELGKIYQKQNRWPEAERILIESLMVDPHQAHVRIALSRIYQLQGRWKDAENILLELAREPHAPNVRRELTKVKRLQDHSTKTSKRKKA